MAKNYFNIDALNKYDIFIPTTTEPELVCNILAAIIAHEQGTKIDYAYKNYGKQIRTAVITQYEKPG